MKVRVMICGVIGLVFLFGCRPTSDKVPKAGEQPSMHAEASPGTATNDHATAQQQLSKHLDEIDAKMADLKTRAQNAGAQAKAEWETRRPQLEAQRETAARKLDELKRSSKEAWEQTRTKTEAAFSELEKGFKEAWAKLKE